jgi:pimeloyl-ACP methyl ester carboxylesterase
VDVRVETWDSPEAPEGVLRLSTRSTVDGLRDWALARPGPRSDTWVVQIHGHGSNGDQLYTRLDIRERWVAFYERMGWSTLTPNLRDNAWMGPHAVVDLHDLLNWLRGTYGARRFIFNSGSMGGTSNLVYAVLHPEDVGLLVARCSATDVGNYHAWLATQSEDVHAEIREAIEAAYGGSPAAVPDVYRAHSAVLNAHQLTMPVLVMHGEADALIPVEEGRRLAVAAESAPDFQYVELLRGDHEAFWQGAYDWIRERDSG